MELPSIDLNLLVALHALLRERNVTRAGEGIGLSQPAMIVGGAPTVPVWTNEISRRALGASVESYSPDGGSVLDQVGELVITAPMPSMPISFWGDPDGTRLRESYFDQYAGTWRHGDWIRIADRGSCIIEGRSDATLNRGGIRMGTAEFDRVVESLPRSPIPGHRHLHRRRRR